MSSNRIDEDNLKTHNYDGIQEYDNPMPGWWTFIFVTNIIWAGVYVVGINLSIFPDYQTDLRAEMEIQEELEQRALDNLPPLTPEMLAEAAGDDTVITAGADVYAMHCSTCHGNQGQGLIGPNLTDTAWINGDGGLDSLHTVVVKGTNKGMPGWGPILGQQSLVSVIAFVKSLQGTTPPNPKAPEGEVAGATPTDEGVESDG